MMTMIEFNEARGEHLSSAHCVCVERKQEELDLITGLFIGQCSEKGIVGFAEQQGLQSIPNGWYSKEWSSGRSTTRESQAPG